jgi:hypothetical protein
MRKPHRKGGTIMAVTNNHPSAIAPSRTSLVAGIAGGISGGIVFGMLMQMMGMMPMIGMLVGAESAAIGWVVHLAISAFIGATFALLFGRRAMGIGIASMLGVLYGIVWWILGALLIMPARLGMGVFVINSMALQSLMGHLMYGLILGVVYELLRPRLGEQ